MASGSVSAAWAWVWQAATALGWSGAVALTLWNRRVRSRSKWYEVAREAKWGWGQQRRAGGCLLGGGETQGETGVIKMELRRAGRSPSSACARQSPLNGALF